MFAFSDKLEEKGVIERKGEKDGRIGTYMVNLSLIKDVEGVKNRSIIHIYIQHHRNQFYQIKTYLFPNITKRKIDRFIVLSLLSPGDIRIFIEEKISPVAVYNGHPIIRTVWFCLE